MTKLEEYDEISLDTFKNIHKKILSGAQFVSDVYDGWREPLCSLYESHHQTAS